MKVLLQIGCVVLFGFSTLAEGQEAPSGSIPDELAIAKSKFLKAQKSLADKMPIQLNGQYLQRIEVLLKSEEAKGNSAAALLLKKELDSFKATGGPAADIDTSSNPEFQKLRNVYSTARVEFEGDKSPQHRSLVAAYHKDLESVVTALTKAGRIDDALIVRAEMQNLASLVLPAAKTLGEAKALTGGRAKAAGAGRLRVVGRVAHDKDTLWTSGEIDGSVFDGITDFVKVVGNEAGVIGLRKSGEIVDMSGRVVADDAIDVIAAPWKYIGVDADGQAIQILRKIFSPDDRRLIQYKVGFYRDLCLLEGGDIFWGNAHYKNGKRQPPPEAARHNVKQIASERTNDFVLKNTGEVIGWDDEGEVAMPTILQRGVKLMAPGRNRTYFLAADNRVYDSKGQLLEGGPAHAKYVAAGGDLIAVLGADNRWSVVARGQTVGKEVELATAVLNHPATVSVRFYLQSGAKDNQDTAAYVAWIEDPTVTTVPFIKVDRGIDSTVTPVPTTTTVPTSAPSSSGTGSQFFGIPIN